MPSAHFIKTGVPSRQSTTPRSSPLRKGSAHNVIPPSQRRAGLTLLSPVDLPIDPMGNNRHPAKETEEFPPSGHPESASIGLPLAVAIKGGFQEFDVDPTHGHHSLALPCRDLTIGAPKQAWKIPGIDLP